MRRILLFVCSPILILLSCKKNEVSPEQKLVNQRKADSAYNSNITAGLGNVFVEEQLHPGSSNQLIFKLSFNQDTLSGYGKVNSSGALEYLNALVLAKQGSNELFISEFYPDISKSRMYTMTNNVKSNIVFDINHISKTKLFASLLDFD